MIQMMNFEHIGTKGKPWGEKEVNKWRGERAWRRSYDKDVVEVLRSPTITAKDAFRVFQYGKLKYEKCEHPLFAIKSKDWRADKPSVLVTGGVHGYETSGVMGALMFITSGAADRYVGDFNFVVAPCVSPWGYEHIQRWTCMAIDPNRSFKRDNADECGTQEAAEVVRLLESCGVNEWKLHVDLHETTDTDELEFRPAKAARDAEDYPPGTIPDGFYLCGDEKNPQLNFQRAVINGVESVTHIAPADPDNTIIGSKVVDKGVILYDYAALGLCAGVTNAAYTTTTEVYPDSASATDDECNRAQVKAVTSALDFIIQSTTLK